MINHKHLILTASLIGGLFFASCGDEGDKNSPEADTGKSPVADSVVVDYDNISDEVFYESIGMVLGDGSRKNLQQAGMDTLVDFEKMEDGFSDGLRGETPGDMNTYIATVREFASGSQSGGEMSKLEIENGSYAIAVVEAMSFKMNASRLNIDSTDMMFDIMSEAYGKSLRGESGGITVPQANEIVDRHMKAIAKKASSE